MCARSTAPARITALARLDSAALKAWHDLRRKLNVLADAALAGRVWMEPLEARTLLSTAVDLWDPALGAGRHVDLAIPSDAAPSLATVQPDGKILVFEQPNWFPAGSDPSAIPPPSDPGAADVGFSDQPPDSTADPGSTGDAGSGGTDTSAVPDTYSNDLIAYPLGAPVLGLPSTLMVQTTLPGILQSGATGGGTDAGGQDGSDYFIVDRFNSDGSLDTTFGNGGRAAKIGRAHV